MRCTRYCDQDIESLQDIHLLDAPSVDQRINLSLTTTVQQHQTALCSHQQVYSWGQHTDTRAHTQLAGQHLATDITDYCRCISHIPQSAAHRISELNLFLYLRISGVSLGGRVLTGFTFTTEPFRDGSDLRGSISLPSCPNPAGNSRGRPTHI